MTSHLKKKAKHIINKGTAIILAGSTALLLTGFAVPSNDTNDKDRLGMALEYFQSRKYHEALLLFEKLNKNYKLNPRFKAYMGVCYFYDNDYQNARKCFNEAIPQLKPLAPHERSVYYYMAAQSCYMTEMYDEAIPLYEQTINVCYDNEKGDALFGIASCYDKMDSTDTAYDFYHSAKLYYTRFNNMTNRKNNIAKIDSVIYEHESNK